MHLLLICHAEGMQDRYSDLGARNGGLTALGWEQSDALANWLRVHRKLDFLVTDARLQSRLTAQRIGQAVGLSVTVNRKIPPYPLALFSQKEAGKPAWQLTALERPIHEDAPSPTAVDAEADQIEASMKPGMEEPFPAAEQNWVEEGAAEDPDPHATQEETARNGEQKNEAENDTESGTGEQESSAVQYETYLRTLIEALDELLAEHWGETIVLITGRETIGAILQYIVCAASSTGHVHFAQQPGGPIGQNYLRIEHTSISELVFRAQGKDAGWSIQYVNRMEHLPEPALPEPSARESTQPAPETQENLTTVIQVYDRNADVVDEEKRASDLKRIHHLINFAKLPADQHILDIGTGHGLLPLVLAEEGAHTVVGIDVSPGMLEQAEYHRLRSAPQAGERVSYRLAAAQTLPFLDERFDAVFCRLLLNHAQNPESIIQEVVRVLRPGGIFILAELLSVDNSVKRATQNAIEERRNPAHVAARSAEQYTKMLEDAGLVIEAHDTVSFERELEEWLSTYDVDRADRSIVREMIEASVETDAAGINARRQGNTIFFDQRLYYLRATKPAAGDT